MEIPSIIDRCDFNPGDTVSNKYRVNKSLGEGSFGKVYSVTNPSGQRYAMKLLRLWDVHPDIRKPLMDRFEMEFHTGQIQCDYLVQALDFGIVGGNPYIIMEFCPGGDLTPLLGNPGAQTSLICQQILLGLHALHTRGKVHRDLKPENVLFKADGKAALTDFGISGDRNKRMTERNIFGKPNQIFGTYAYMPPEQVNRARGEATVLPTTDIFSFGILAFQLLTGELPFGPLTNHNELAMYQRRAKNEEWNHSLLRNVPHSDKWKAAIGGCLKPNFKNRLQSVEELLRLIPQTNGSATPQLNLNVVRPQIPMQSSHGGFCLRVMHGEDYGCVFPLNEIVNKRGRVLTLGRNDSNIIMITENHSNYLSRWHCSIETNPQMDKWVIRDGQWHTDQRQWQFSSNGTFVNSTQVYKDGYVLSPGDIISIGDVKMRFENN